MPAVKTAVTNTHIVNCHPQLQFIVVVVVVVVIIIIIIIITGRKAYTY